MRKITSAAAWLVSASISILVVLSGGQATCSRATADSPACHIAGKVCLSVATLKRRIDNAALTLPFSAIGAKNAIYPQQAQDAPIRFVFRERQRPYFQDCFNQIRLVQQIRQENGVLNSAIKAPYNRAGCAKRISRRNIEAYCQSDTLPWRGRGLGGG